MLLIIDILEYISSFNFFLKSQYRIPILNSLIFSFALGIHLLIPQNSFNKFIFSFPGNWIPQEDLPINEPSELLS